jgi:hypothetical protein
MLNQVVGRVSLPKSIAKEIRYNLKNEEQD